MLDAGAHDADLILKHRPNVFRTVSGTDREGDLGVELPGQITRFCHVARNRFDLAVPVPASNC